jgi:ankyrin repeat protein
MSRRDDEQVAKANAEHYEKGLEEKNEEAKSGDPDYDNFLTSCERGEDEQVRMLFQKGKAKGEDYSNRHDAKKDGLEDPALVEEAMYDGNAPRPNLSKNRGDYPLHYAAGSNSASTVSLLVQLGADLDNENSWGATALHRAVSANALESVKALLSAGAVLECKTSQGQLPLHIAAYAGFTEIIEELLRVGDERSSRQRDFADNMGFLPKQYASVNAAKVLLGADESDYTSGFQGSEKKVTFKKQH